MQSGRTAIARWTVPAEQFGRFVEEDQRLANRKFTTNFYQPPNATPPAGLEVIFSDDGVRIGDGDFPLSTTRGRRVLSVQWRAKWSGGIRPSSLGDSELLCVATWRRARQSNGR